MSPTAILLVSEQQDCEGQEQRVMRTLAQRERGATCLSQAGDVTGDSIGTSLYGVLEDICVPAGWQAMALS